MAFRFAIVILTCLLGASVGRADITTTIDFEGLPAGTPVNSSYPGLVFANATIATAGVNLNDSEFPPRSGVNVAIDDSGPITIDFLTPAVSFEAYFTYTTQLTLTAFNASHVAVDTATSLFTSNFVSSGNPPNELLSLSSAGGISSILLSGDPGGASLTMDDMTYVTPTGAVPEPSSVVLLATIAFIAFGGRSGMRRSSARVR